MADLYTIYVVARGNAPLPQVQNTHSPLMNRHPYDVLQQVRRASLPTVVSQQGMMPVRPSSLFGIYLALLRSRYQHQALNYPPQVNQGPPRVPQQRHASLPSLQTGNMGPPRKMSSHSSPITPVNVSGGSPRPAMSPTGRNGQHAVPSPPQFRRPPLQSPSVIDLTSDDDMPLAQRARKRPRLEAFGSFASSSPNISPLGSALPLGSPGTEITVPPPMSREPSPAPANEPREGTLADEDGLCSVEDCLEAAFSQDSEDENKVWCQMCQLRYEACKDFMPDTPVPEPFNRADRQILVEHCETLHPAGWAELRRPEAESEEV